VLRLRFDVFRLCFCLSRRQRRRGRQKYKRNTFEARAKRKQNTLAGPSLELGRLTSQYAQNAALPVPNVRLRSLSGSFTVRDPVPGSGRGFRSRPQPRSRPRASATGCGRGGAAAAVQKQSFRDQSWLVTQNRHPPCKSVDCFDFSSELQVSF
jgi:hypothetical protein